MVTDTLISKGYSKTDVGVIPDDWEVKRLGDIAAITRGASPRPIDSPIWFDETSKIGWVRISDVTKSTKLLKYTTQKLSELGIKHSRFVRKGNLIMSICATVGRPILTELDVCIHDGFVVFSDPKIEKEYLYYILSFIEDDWSKNGQTGSQMNLNTGLINFKQIAFPKSKPEQTAIATALSDVDVLISKLEELISKKINIKQGAMQQLLIGKKRLPGFSGKWERKKLRKILSYEQPTKYIVKSTEYYDNNEVAVLTANKSFILGYTDEKDNVFENFPVVIFDDFTTASKYVDFPFKVKSSALKILRLKDESADLRFVFGKMQLIQFPLGDHKRYWISEYQHLEIEVPSFEEQSAIAQVLSDMDAEIDELEQKLDKYKMIKQGMMQELLTGRTRLI